MKLTTGILAMAITMTAGAAFSARAVAQNPDAIDNARSIAKSLQQKQANDSNAALNPAGSAAKPAPGAPAPAVKPAVIPGSEAVAAAPASKPAPAAKPAPASGQHNQLQRVNVVQGTDSIRIEISSSGAVTPRVTKLDSPARILVALPETTDVTPKNHIAVGSGGVKEVRIGMDGQTPPTTSVVVDLEKALAFELTPGPSDKLVLTVHGQAVAKSSPTPAPATAKTAAPAAQPQTVAKAAPAAAKAQPAPAAKAQPAPAVAKSSPAPAKVPEIQLVAKTTPPEAKAPVASNAAPAKPAVTANAPAKPAEKQPAAKDTKAAATVLAPAPADATKSADAAKAQPKPEDKKWAMTGKRDPFFSPVVQQPGGSGCSTGKKCLEIGNINLRGVVKSDSGFIAVVTNSLNKAYFLRENDPVFNGYVVKITGDSVVFQETVEDKLGKPFTREVVKRIFTPAV
ncbi:MAG: AMIN domain-containing protein [Candidatus Sulfotelmatobacter sp.]|jgi:Tfp pilus assembly protein PilP